MRVSLLLVFAGCFNKKDKCENTEAEQGNYSMDEFFEETAMFFCEVNAMCSSGVDCSDEEIVSLYWGELFGGYSSYSYVNYDVCQAHICIDMLLNTEDIERDCNERYWETEYYEIFENECGDYKTYEIQ